MGNQDYFNNLNTTIKNYFEVLVDKIPYFLHEYINTPELQRIGKIGMNCGTDYTKIFNNKFFYSRLDHSIGVALIIWNFTKDKKQTLAGLFHDIATPCFSHCIDFLHKDYINQEVTEADTRKIIEESQEIMELLRKDNILIDEVCDYKIYPIADNSTPKLSADRLEYTLSSGISFTKEWTLSDVKEIYSNLAVFSNEDGIIELGFKDKEIAEKFVNGASKMWMVFLGNKDKLVMQFIADSMKTAINKKVFEEADLYKYSEIEIINKIINCNETNLSNNFKNFMESVDINEGVTPPKDNYYIGFDVKKRYINPLVKDTRLTDLSAKAKELIEQVRNYKFENYAWFQFRVL